MNYKTITKDSKVEDWVLHSYDRVAFIPAHEADRYPHKKTAMIEQLKHDLINQILRSDDIEYMEEYDVMRQGYLMAVRLKWLAKEEEDASI